MEFEQRLLSQLFDRVTAYPMATAGLRFKTALAAMLLSHDFRDAALTVLGHSKKFIHSKSSIMSLRAVAKAIDDKLDSMDPAQIAAAGETTLGLAPSPFLKNPDVIAPEYLPLLQELDDIGVVSYNVSVSYSNIFAEMSRQKALSQACAVFDPQARRHVAQLNLDLGAVYSCFFYGLLAPSAKLAQGFSDIDDVRHAYPQIYQISKTMQAMDDLRDILIDLDQESTTQHISSNFVLASGIDTIKDQDEVNAFWQTAKHRTDKVPFADLPIPLQHGIVRAGCEYQSMADKISSFSSRQITLSFWRNSVREGFMTPAHPTAQHDRSYNTASYEEARHRIKHMMPKDRVLSA